MKFYILTLFSLILPLTAQLEQPLQDHGGHHFQFEGHKYMITMDVNGKISFTSKELFEQDTSMAQNHRMKFRYRSYSKKSDQNKIFEFIKLKTDIEKKFSSFILYLEGEMENGVKVKSKIQGSRNKINVMTEASCPEPYYFRLGFYVGDSPSQLESKSKIIKLTHQQKKSLYHCSNVYPTTYYKQECRQILIQKRNPLDMIFKVNQAEGHFVLVQHSHYAGGHLNNPFVIYYKSPSQNWNSKKNTITLSF